MQETLISISVLKEDALVFYQNIVRWMYMYFLSKNQIFKLHTYIFFLIIWFTVFFHVTNQARVLFVLGKSFYHSLEEVRGDAFMCLG